MSMQDECESQEEQEQQQEQQQEQLEMQKQRLEEFGKIWTGKIESQHRGEHRFFDIPDQEYSQIEWLSLKRAQTANIVPIAEGIISGKVRLALFTGRHGRGKTEAAWAITHGWLRKVYLAQGNGKGTIYDNFPYSRWKRWSRLQILFRRVAAFGIMGDAAETELKQYHNCGLLVIDEYCLTEPKDAQLELLHDLIDERYAKFRPTILTTARTVQEVEAMTGGGIISRIAGNIAEFKSTDHRR